MEHTLCQGHLTWFDITWKALGSDFFVLVLHQVYCWLWRRCCPGNFEDLYWWWGVKWNLPDILIGKWLNWKERGNVIRSQQRQKIGTAESNKEQLKDKPGRVRKRQLQYKKTNENTGRILRNSNCTVKGVGDCIQSPAHRRRAMGYFHQCTSELQGRKGAKCNQQQQHLNSTPVWLRSRNIWWCFYFFLS